jgi:WhiB family redox-sensing transcriptional regulator
MSHPIPIDTDAVPCRRDPERMFPVADKPGGYAASVERAKAVCRTCPLVDPCFAYAIRVDVAGVWGNSSEQERQEFRKNNGIVPIPVVSSPYSMRAYAARVTGAA